GPELPRGLAGARLARAPGPEDVPRVDAGAVAGVPFEVEAPVADLLRPLDAQRLGRPGAGPRHLPPVAEVAALGALAPHPQALQAEAADVAVAPRDGHAVLPLDVDELRCRLRFAGRAHGRPTVGDHRCSEI